MVRVVERLWLASAEKWNPVEQPASPALPVLAAAWGPAKQWKAMALAAETSLSQAQEATPAPAFCSATAIWGVSALRIS
jgi:hypothetical protein